MKKALSLLSLAVLTVGMLGSCSKINERLDNLEKKVSGIENEQIASINSQISGITSSISDLGQIRSDISSLKQSASDHSVDIFNLEEADRALKDRILNLEDYVDAILPNYAEKEWVEATFSTLAQYEATCDTIAKIDARIGALDAKLSKDIKATADSLTKWVNKQFEGYYTAAEMDAKLAQMKSAIDSSKASGKITDAKADSISAELTKTKTAVDTAKAAIRAEYKAAIKSAIETSEGKLTKDLNDAITEVNGKITSLATRVSTLESSVATLTGRVDKLEGMIQSVTIVPAYSDGSVEIKDDTLFIDCVITPASTVSSLTKTNFTVLVNKVLTKAVNIETISITDDKLISRNLSNGTVSLKIPVKNYIPASDDSTITVAVNVKNGNSNFTTEFVPVYVAGPALPGPLPGVFSVSDTTKVRFSPGNLYVKKDNSGNWNWNFYDKQYACNSLNSTYNWDTTTKRPISKDDDNESDLFSWGYGDWSKGLYSSKYYVKGHDDPEKDGEQFSKTEDWGYAFGGESSVWRTLNVKEWEYLFGNSTERNGKYKCGVTVCGHPNCVVLLPDNWKWEGAVGTEWQNTGNVFEYSEETTVKWSTMEEAGAVCLPSAGYSSGADVRGVELYCAYWTSSGTSEVALYGEYYMGSDYAHYLWIDPGVKFYDGSERSQGNSVRLVTDVK